MALDPILGATIGATANVAGGYFGYKGVKAQNKTNIKLAQQAQDYDNRMWHEKNAYNAPEMQMQRMREAGLNPNLIAGGTTQAGNADNAQKAPIPQVQNTLGQMAQMDLVPMLSAYTDMQVKSQTTKNLELDGNTKLLMNEILKDTLDEQKNTIRNRARSSESQSYSDTTKATMDSYDLQVREGGYQKEGVLQEIKGQEKKIRDQQELIKHSSNATQQRARQLELENMLNEKLYKGNTHKGDELWQRILAPIITDLFENIKNSKVGKNAQSGGKFLFNSLFN